MKTSSPVIQRLDAARVELGLSTRQFDARAGMSAGQWSRIWTRQAAQLFSLDAYAKAAGLVLVLVPAARELRPHGTAAAAKRHRSHGEPLCALCRQWDRDRKRAARALARANGPRREAAA